MSTSTTQPTAEAAAGTSENPITVDSSAGTKRGREPETEAAPAGDAADQPKIDAALQAGEPAEEVAKENGAAAGHGEATEEAPSTKKRKVEAEEPAPAAQKGAVNGAAAGQPKSANLNAVEAESAEKPAPAETKEATNGVSKTNGQATSVPSAREPPPTSTTATDGPSTDVNPLQDAPQQPETAPGDDEHLAHPEKWATGDEAATSKQKGFIAVLEKKAGQTGPDGITGGEGLTKAEASERIEELKTST